MNSLTVEPTTRLRRTAARAGRPATSWDKRRLRELLERRYAIVPQMRDYDTLERKAWLPYLMTFHPSQLRTPTFATDEAGFRRTFRRGEPVTRDAYNATGCRRAALIGGSAAFGVGASSDAGTLASRLNEQQQRVWWNFAGRGFNSTQELLVFLLYLPQDVEQILIFSGANNLVLSHLAGSTSPIYNSFYAQSVFERGLRSGLVTGVRGSLNLLVREMARKLAAPDPAQYSENDQTRYEHVITCVRRDLRLWALLSQSLGCPVRFVFQPMAMWIDKILAPEEEELFAILDRCDPTGSWAGVGKCLQREQERYVSDVRRICEEFRIPFLDLNRCAAWTQRRWLFVDRAHLTDEGYALAVEEITKEWPS